MCNVLGNGEKYFSYLSMLVLLLVQTTDIQNTIVSTFIKIYLSTVFCTEYFFTEHIRF